jgi:hypothetical protein
MGLIDISTVEGILPYIVATVFSAILILIIRPFITERFKNKERKKRRSIWIAFLRTNEIINECLERFEKIEFSEEKWPNLGGFILGLIAFFILRYLYNIILGPSLFDFLAIAYSCLVIGIVPFVSVIILRQFKNKQRNLLQKSKIITNLSEGINWFIFSSSELILIFIYIIYASSSQIFIVNLVNIRIGFAASLFFMILAYFLNTNFRRDFFNDLKSNLNTLHLNDFPTICITTKAEMFSGKIQNIFDEDLIILDDNGEKKAVVWDDVIILKLVK